MDKKTVERSARMQAKQLFVLAVLVCVVSSLTPAKGTIGGCFPTPMVIKFRPDLADPTSNSTINLSGGDDPDSGYSFDALLPIKWEFNERQDSITISAKDKNGKLQTFRWPTMLSHFVEADQKGLIVSGGGLDDYYFYPITIVNQGYHGAVYNASCWLADGGDK